MASETGLPERRLPFGVNAAWQRAVSCAGSSVDDYLIVILNVTGEIRGSEWLGCGVGVRTAAYTCRIPCEGILTDDHRQRFPSTS